MIIIFFCPPPLDDGRYKIKFAASNQSFGSVNLRFIGGGPYGDKVSSPA